MAARPLQHVDAEKKDDDALRVEARSHLAEAPSLQLVAELLAKLRRAGLPFWSPAVLRERWNAAERMRWLRQRPDLRQKITTALSGLAPKASRKKLPDFQAALIDSVIDEGDISVRAFEDSFEPTDLAVYGPAAGFWHAVRELFPWHDDAPAHQEIVAWLLKALLADTSSIAGLGRVPILTAWDLRTAIDGRVWHTRIPIEVRVAIDDARLSQERDRPGVPFHAQDDLAIAVAEVIAASVPLRDLTGVLAAAERAMGFDKEGPRPKGPPDLKPPVDPPARKSITPPPLLAANETTSTDDPSQAVAPAPAPLMALVLPVEPMPAPRPMPVPELRRTGPTPGVPTLEDELERTNPWVVPSDEELAAGAAELAASGDADSLSSGRRRRRG